MPYCASCGTQVDQISYAPCPSCGNPTNGAARPQVTGGTNTGVIIAIVVGALLVIVAIVGILAAIAIPNFLTATQRAKQKRTMADIRSMATAVEAYAVDKNQYPDPDSLEQALVPTYIKTLPETDGWKQPLLYDCWSSSDEGACDSYAIASGGRDGEFEFDSPDQYMGRGGTTNFDADIVMINGNFVQYPQGTPVN
ncbi:MAG TPA: type II secretion system protein GspG [Thermoanaerobaculia bacterium]|nr:type II secretion system protein GspG [Thermoanaerobaculia bacterium]